MQVSVIIEREKVITEKIISVLSKNNILYRLFVGFKIVVFPISGMNQSGERERRSKGGREERERTKAIERDE